MIDTPENDARMQQPWKAPRQAAPVSLGAQFASAVFWLWLALTAPFILVAVPVIVMALWHAAAG
jgi:hypothetical protein